MKWKKDEIKTLYYDKMYSTVEIANIKGCSDKWIRYLMDKWDLPRRSYSSAFKLYAEKYPNKGRIKPDFSNNKDVAYILGVILGDGWVYKNNYNYKVGLSVVEKKFAESFAESLHNIGLNPGCYLRSLSCKNKKWKDQWVITANSKIFYKWYKEKTFENIKDIVGNYGIHFIRGFYESEGTLLCKDNNLRVTIYNSKKELLEYIKDILLMYNFKCSITNTKREGKLREYSLNVLNGRKKTEEFLSLIQPVIKGLTDKLDSRAKRTKLVVNKDKDGKR